MSVSCGIQQLAVYSARLGGAGYHIFVLRRDICFLFRMFSWDTFEEMLKYISITDVHNSYALFWFTALGSTELCNTADSGVL